MTNIDINGSVIVKPLSFENKKRYKLLSTGKIRRYKSGLDFYQYQICFNATPDYVSTTIEDYFRQHVPISQNKNDLVKRHQSLHHAQFKEKQSMMCYQAMNEVWHQFIEEHTEMAMGM